MVTALTTENLCVIVPSRGRPQNIRRLVQGFEDTGTSAELIVAVDGDDEKLQEYLDGRAASEHEYTLVVGPRQRLIGTLNHVASSTITAGFTYVGFMGDDHLPRTAGWDQRYLEALGPGGIVYGNDLIQGPNLPTQVALDRRIVTTLGFMAPPALVHLYADNFWLDLGHALGTLTYLDDVIVQHLHPIAGTAEWDAGYVEVNAGTRNLADCAAYDRYRAEQFDADLAKLREVFA